MRRRRLAGGSRIGAGAIEVQHCPKQHFVEVQFDIEIEPGKFLAFFLGRLPGFLEA